MWNAELNESQAGIKVARRNINNLRYVDDTWSHHFMADRWGKMEIVTDFIFLGSKITTDGDCSHETKRCLLLGRKAMTNLDSILKSRGITLPIKIWIVKVMVVPVITYGCESWTIKKAECQRTVLFKWGAEDSRVPWTARRSNQSILMEINPEYLLEGLMLKLKLQIWPPDVKSWLTGEGPDVGKVQRQDKGATEDEMVGWHHQLKGCEFEQTL